MKRVSEASSCHSFTKKLASWPSTQVPCNLAQSCFLAHLTPGLLDAHCWPYICVHLLSPTRQLHGEHHSYHFPSKQHCLLLYSPKATVGTPSNSPCPPCAPHPAVLCEPCLLLPASWCLDNQGLAEPGETAPSTSEFLERTSNLPFCFSGTDQPTQNLHPTHLFYQGLTFQPTFTCTNHPRARYQTARDSSMPQRPLKLYKPGDSKAAYLA